MSQCIRNISNKFTTVNSVLNTRKHARHLDKELLGSSSSVSPRHEIKSSPFLQEFLNARTMTSLAVERNSDRRDVVSNVYKVCDATTEGENDGKKTDRRYSVSPISSGQVMCGLKRYEISSDDIMMWENRTDDLKSIIINEEIESLEKTYLRLSNGPAMLATNNSILSDFEKRMILLANDVKINNEKIEGNDKNSNDNLDGKPSNEQLQRIHDNLSRMLPAFFTEPLDYKIYNQNVEFINNIRGTVTRGLLNYIKQMALLRAIGHLRFAYVKFEVIKITTNAEDSSIKVRWRIRGISGFRALAYFWKIKLWKMSETYDNQELWYDGFSSFYVGGDGLIYKHVADKMMPDQDDNQTAKDQNAVAAKLALFLGLLVPGGTICDMYNLTTSVSSRQHYLYSLVKESNGDKVSLVTDHLFPLEKLK